MHIPIEFKVGARNLERLDYEQAWDYGLDLKNIHAPSLAAPIFPILCATEARDSNRPTLTASVRRFALEANRSAARSSWLSDQPSPSPVPSSPLLRFLT